MELLQLSAAAAGALLARVTTSGQPGLQVRLHVLLLLLSLLLALQQLKQQLNRQQIVLQIVSSLLRQWEQHQQEQQQAVPRSLQRNPSCVVVGCLCSFQGRWSSKQQQQRRQQRHSRRQQRQQQCPRARHGVALRLLLLLLLHLLCGSCWGVRRPPCRHPHLYPPALVLLGPLLLLLLGVWVTPGSRECQARRCLAVVL
jgi:hypothetical protein